VLLARKSPNPERRLSSVAVVAKSRTTAQQIASEVIGTEATNNNAR
jgi:hypothetical protein